MVVTRFRSIGWIVAVLTLAADQLAKWFVTGPLRLMDVDTIEILPIFRLQWVANHGVSMGFLVANSDGQRWALALGTAVIAVFVAVWLARETRKVGRASCRERVSSVV